MKTYTIEKVKTVRITETYEVPARSEAEALILLDEYNPIDTSEEVMQSNVTEVIEK